MDEPPPRSPHASLWSHACGLYARPEVRALCLDWQARFRADVPLVLALCWQAAQGRRAPDDHALERLILAMAPWRRDTVLRLRRLRTRLGPLSLPGSRNARLRQAILDVELAAERVQMDFLADTLPRMQERSAATPRENLRAGLDRYLVRLGLSEDQREREIVRLLRAVTA